MYNYIYTVNGINANNGRSCDFHRTVQIITLQWRVRDEHINNNSPILLYQTFNILSLRKLHRLIKIWLVTIV